MRREHLERFEKSLEINPRTNEYLRLSSQELQTDSAHRVVAAAHKVHLIGQPACVPSTQECVAQLESVQRPQASLDLAMRVASESIVLLRNDGTLPLQRSRDVQTVAFIGAALSAR
eukprot:223058-Amphidinium_carterae.1